MIGPEPEASCSSSPSTKRCRDLEDEIYIDNLTSHKRYLSEVMASSLNGLTVDDVFRENPSVSPARDDVPIIYSPMSEDSDDSRDSDTCAPASPISPCTRSHKPHPWFSSAFPTPPYNSLYIQPRHRTSDPDSRLPSSPSDVCHSADLRRAALLRSVQMRTQNPHFGHPDEADNCEFTKVLQRYEAEENQDSDSDNCRD